MILKFFGAPVVLREIFNDMAFLRGCELRNEATRVFGDREKAMQWIVRPNRALGNDIPLYVAVKSDQGLKRVRNVLGRIEYGVYS